MQFPFVWDCRNRPHQAPTYFEPSGWRGHKVTTIYLQWSTAALPSLATSKISRSACWPTSHHEEQPVYLHSLIATSLPSCSLRSNRGITRSIPRIRTNTGAKAFTSCAPSLWNNLPLSMRSATSVATFRRRLKTYLFDLAFPPQTLVCPTACWCYGIASTNQGTLPHLLHLWTEM